VKHTKGDGAAGERAASHILRSMLVQGYGIKDKSDRKKINAYIMQNNGIHNHVRKFRINLLKPSGNFTNDQD
jgi:hypothetical protein